MGYSKNMAHIKRIISSDLKSHLFKGKAIILYGPRQSGKTTFTKDFANENNLDPIFLNGDDDFDVELFSTVTMSKWTQILGDKNCVFIDEGQKIKNIGRSVKLLIDIRPEIQVFITGSSSFQIATKTQEPLTVRKFEYNLFPLSFLELANHFGILEERKKLELRLIYGTYPEVVTHEDSMKELLKLIADSYLYKDLFQYEGIRKPKILEKLVKALAFQVGSEVSVNELSSLVGVSRTLIESYLTLLCEAYIIFPLTSYSTNQRNELKKSVKYYFWDNGIRNSVINDFSPVSKRQDIGQLWENYLMSERAKKNRYEKAEGFSYFWRTTDQMEVDYLEVKSQNIDAYEFKWNATKNSRVTKAFTNRYPNANVHVITPENYTEFLG